VVFTHTEVSVNFVILANIWCYFSLQSEVEVSNLNRRIRNMEDEMEQLTTKLRTTNDKLEDIAKAADECERLKLLKCLTRTDEQILEL